MRRYFYSDSISGFQETSQEHILGVLTQNNEFSVEQTQVSAWVKQIQVLKKVLQNYDGAIFFEYSIPRMGRRIDVVLIIGSIIFILEFKTGEQEHSSYAIDQVWDYALDLKNFHSASQQHLIAPILIASGQRNNGIINLVTTNHNDNILF